MADIEDILISALTMEEILSDGSTLTNPAADSRRLFLGEDGQLHLRDSAGTVTNPAVNVPLVEPTVTEGQLGWDPTGHTLQGYDTQRARGLATVGWTPWAAQPGNSLTNAWGTSRTLAANGGSIAVMIDVHGQMLLDTVVLWNRDTATARSWRWDLYVQDLNNGNAGENTLRRVATANASDAFTPGAASVRTIVAASAPVYLPPGVYWLVIQNDHATSTFALGTTGMTLGLVNTAMTKTTTNPNGATLDFVAATWTKVNDAVGAFLSARVFGETVRF